MLAKNEFLQNRYRVESRLGQGGMGAVYEASDTKRFGKRVALKEILLQSDSSSDLRHEELLKQVFEREAKILSSLEHEAFPQVIDYFVEGGNQFLVMELIQGENLSSMLDRRSCPFEPEVVLGWTEELLDALDYLHNLENPVYHRDIKPQNIKLSLRGRVKLLDFGIAKASESGAGLTITNQTFVAATLHYSPLEQIIKAVDDGYREFLLQNFGAKFQAAEKDQTDQRSDIYALGATVYHLLTNCLPVDSLKRAMQVFGGKDDPLAAPHVLNPQIPRAISDWLLKALELEKPNRYSSARQMLAALQRAVETSNQDEKEEQLKDRTDFTEDWRQDETLQILLNKDSVIAPVSSSVSISVSGCAKPAVEFFLDETDACNYRTATSYLRNLEPEKSAEIKIETNRMIEESKKDDSPTNSPFFVVAAVMIFVLFSAAAFGLWALLPGVRVAAQDQTSEEVVQSAPATIEQPVVPVIPETKPETSVVPVVRPEPAPSESKTPAGKSEKPTPAVVPKKNGKTPKNKPKKQNPCQPVTVDCIIRDN